MNKTTIGNWISGAGTTQDIIGDLAKKAQRLRALQARKLEEIQELREAQFELARKIEQANEEADHAGRVATQLAGIVQ